MAKTHALGLLVGEHRLTACNAYLARAVKVSDNVAEVDCSKCVKAIGASNSDEGLAADHRYRDPRTGELLPFSVTSIARSFDPGDPFGAGAAWGARLQREGKDWREVRDAHRISIGPGTIVGFWATLDGREGIEIGGQPLTVRHLDEVSFGRAVDAREGAPEPDRDALGAVARG